MRNLRSPNLRKKRRRRLIIKVSLFVFGLILIVGIPALLSHIPGILIRDIEVVGTEGLLREDIKKVAEEELRGKYLWLFPRKNSIYFPKEKIENKILNNFPQIESLKSELSSFHALNLSVVERKTVSLWCENNLAISCYSMDKDGFVFEKNGVQSSNVYFVYHGYITGEPIGQYYLPKGILIKVQTFIEGVKLLGFEPTSLSHLNEKEYVIKIKGGGEIFFIFDENIDKALSNLESVVEDDSLEVLKNGELTVRAIDLRYGNKIILKK